MRLFEDGNRTTIYGITAVVLIVFFVALSINVRHVELFPENNRAGRATGSFYGIRTAELSEFKILTTKFLVGKTSVVYEVYIDSELLVVAVDNDRYETTLRKGNDGFYHATHPFLGRSVEVTVAPEMQILWAKGLLSYNPDKNVVASLKEERVFDGVIKLRDKKIYIQFRNNKLFIDDGKIHVVELKKDGDALKGKYDDHEVFLDLSSMTVTITNFY